jgi:subtilisin family serine protease
MAKGKKGKSAAKKTIRKVSKKAGKKTVKKTVKKTGKAAKKSTRKAVPRAARRPAAPPALLFDAGLESIVRKSSELSGRVSELAQDVSFTVASKTVSGKAIQDQIGLLNDDNLKDFHPDMGCRERAISKLESEGCKLIRRGRFSVTMSGPAAVVEKLIGTKLVVQARARRTTLRSSQMFATDFDPPMVHDLFVAPPTSLSMPTAASADVDHLVFIPPPVYFAPSPNPPRVGYHHVDDAAIRRILNVPAGFDGNGVRVAMVDTGFFPHPYYSTRNLKFSPTPTATAPRPQVDDYGHGTAVAYNVFATAPKAELLGFQQTDPPQDALEDAAAAGVDIISCSWGWDREQVFPLVQASLLSIIAEGKIVLFAAGNGQYSWPGSEPNVISIGGVYSDEQGALQVSNYASGYMSGMFPNRRIPDVSGLCGQRPKAIYIVMPTQPANTMDDEFSTGGAYPNGDETTASDGWLGASGTSSATPQIAGVVALMVQKARAAGRTLNPADAKDALARSCRPITAGRNAMGFPPVGQPNTAVGFGLVDATAALNLV